MIGPWCVNSQNSKQNNLVLFDDSNINHTDIKKIQKICDEIYEDTIFQLSKVLNEIHNESHSERYWKIIIGPWLKRFIHVTYEKKISLENVFKKFPKININSLEALLCPPADFTDFQNGLKSEEYNLRLYSEILDFLEKDYNIINRDAINNLWNYDSHKFSFSNLIRSFISKFFFYYSANKKIIIYSLFNRKIDEVRLFLKKPLTYGLMFRYLIRLNRANISETIRYNKIRIKASGNNIEFYDLLNNILWKNIPIAHIEKYKYLKNHINPFPLKAKVLASANAWKTDEKLKIMAAILAERDCKIITAQHGGNTGISSHSPMESHLIDISDRYFFFGSGASYPDNKNKIKKINFPNLVLPQKKVQKSQNNILYLTNDVPKFFIHYRYGPIKNNTLIYKKDQFSLIKKLIANSNEKIIIRAPGQNYFDKLIESHINVEFDNMQRRFEEVVSCSKIVIVDNINTTFTQCLLLNKPTILFVNSLVWDFDDDFLEIAKILEDAGILFYDIDKAVARFINLSNDQTLWFKCNEIKNAKAKFLSKYTSHSNNWQNQWIKELESII